MKDIKRKKYVLLLNVLCILSYSCIESDWKNEGFPSLSAKYLSVSESNIFIGSEKGNQSIINIETFNDWSISNIPSWISVTPTSGQGNGSITISVTEENPSSSSTRSGSFLINYEGTSKTITITQDISKSLSLSPINASVSALGGDVELTITGNIDWTLSINTDWATTKTHNGTGSAKITVNCGINNTDNERSATVSAKNANGIEMAKCIITQSVGILPIVEVPTVSNVSNYSATINSKFSSESTVSECGICYSNSNQTPSMNDIVIKKSCNDLTGSIIQDITNLESGLTYYVRAFATNIFGTSYSDTFKFKTGGSTPSEDDNITPNLTKKR